MARFRSLVLFLALALALAALSTACGDDDDDEGESTPSPNGSAAAEATLEPSSVTFMAGFKPQANLPFVGAYVAQEKGFFDDENLDVDIRHVATPGDNFRLLAAGEVQFSTADASAVLEHRASDPSLPIVSIALIGQRGQQGFAVLAGSDIASPADWTGKRAGYKGSQVTPDYLAILAEAGVDRSSVEEVKVGFEPQVLTEGQVDIFPVFVSNEPDTLQRLGFETTVFQAADYGAPTLGLTYIATEDFIAEKPDVAQRFLRAVLRGIQYADANRAEAIDIVLEYAPLEDPEHQRYMLDTELDMAADGLLDGQGIGWQTADEWQMLHDYLVQYGALSAPLDDVSAAFTAEFVEDVYAHGTTLEIATR